MTKKFKDPCYRLWDTLVTRGAGEAKKWCRTSPAAPMVPSGIRDLVSRLEDTAGIKKHLDPGPDHGGELEGWQALFTGIARLYTGQAQAGIALISRALETGICRAPALVYLADIHLQQGQAKQACRIAREAIALDTGLGEPHLILARVLLKGGTRQGQTWKKKAALAKGRVSRFSLVRLELETLIHQNRQTDAVSRAVDLLRNGIQGVNPHQTMGFGLTILITCGALDEAENFMDQALEKSPRDLVLLDLRAETAMLTGKYQMAGAAVRRILARDPDHSGALVKIARLSGQIFSKAQAIRALDRLMERARESGPSEEARILGEYGGVHLEAEDLEDAEAAYQKALDKDPECLAALGGLARVLTINGALEKAREIQDRVHAISPVKAVQMMIQSDRLPEDSQDLDRVKRLSEDPASPLQMRASLSLCLAKVCQKRNKHHCAMAHARSANEMFKTFLSYDHLAEAEQADRIISRMSAAFFKSRTGFGTHCRLPIFIVGMPRSGTTLVEQILGSHSRVFPGGELGLIPRMWRRLKAWEHRLGSPFRRMPDCALELSADQSQSFARKVEAEYRELMPEEGALAHITDKLPHNFTNIGLIKLLFPDARIIYCRRHPGGIGLSNYFTDYKARHGGMGFAYDLTWLGYEIGNCHRLMAHWQTLFGNTIHVVDYETLVDRPETIVRAMLYFIGLDWEHGVMAFNRLKRPVKTASVNQVRQPIYRGASQRWRSYESDLSPMFKALSKRKDAPWPEPAPLPGHPPSLFLAGMDHLESGRYAQAEKIFLRLVNAHPGHAAGLHMLGVSQLHQGRAGSAQKNMEKSIALHPGNPAWYDNLAVLLDRTGQRRAARDIRDRKKAAARSFGYISETGIHDTRQC